MTDPNPEYDIFERITGKAYEKHFPNKRVKVNKYKCKLSPWMTSGLIKSIEFRNKLYKRLKASRNIPFNDYLKSPCQQSFQFQYTMPDSIDKNCWWFKIIFEIIERHKMYHLLPA